MTSQSTRWRCDALAALLLLLSGVTSARRLQQQDSPLLWYQISPPPPPTSPPPPPDSPPPYDQWTPSPDWSYPPPPPPASPAAVHTRDDSVGVPGSRVGTSPSPAATGSTPSDSSTTTHSSDGTTTTTPPDATTNNPVNNTTTTPPGTTPTPTPTDPSDPSAARGTSSSGTTPTSAITSAEASQGTQQQQGGSSAPKAHGKSKGGNAATIGGAVGGCLGSLVVIAALLYFILWRNAKRNPLDPSYMGVAVVATQGSGKMMLGPATATAAVATSVSKYPSGPPSKNSTPRQATPPKQKGSIWTKMPLLTPSALGAAQCTPVEASAALMQLRGAATLLMSSMERSNPDMLGALVSEVGSLGVEEAEGRMFVRQAVLHRIWSWFAKQLWDPEGPCWQEPLLPPVAAPLLGSRAVQEAQLQFLEHHVHLTSGIMEGEMDATVEEIARWMAADLGLQAQGAPWLKDATALVRQAVVCRLIIGAVHPCLSMRVSNALPPDAGVVAPLDRSMPLFKPSVHCVGREYASQVQLNMEQGASAVLMCMLPGAGFEGEMSTLKKQGVTVEGIKQMEILEEVAVMVQQELTSF